MACGRFLTLIKTPSRSLAKPGRQFFQTNKNYGKASNGNSSLLMEERAPSTAEEFQRVAEQKAIKANMASHDVNKSFGDAQQKGNIDDPKVEPVYKEQKIAVDYSKRGRD